MFHCDPHAGNLFWTATQRLAILDWSLVGSLGNRQREAIVQILLGGVTLQPARIVAVLESLSTRQRPDRAALMRVVHAWLRRIRSGQLPGLTWLTGMLDEAVQLARLRVATDLLLFRKSLLTLQGVLAEINGGAVEMDAVLMGDFCQNLITEWPRRWVSLPYSRDFATRLSNVDLAHTILSWPSTLTRFWLDQSLDVLHSGDISNRLSQV